MVEIARSIWTGDASPDAVVGGWEGGAKLEGFWAAWRRLLIRLHSVGYS